MQSSKTLQKAFLQGEKTKLNNPKIKRKQINMQAQNDEAKSKSTQKRKQIIFNALMMITGVIETFAICR